MGNGTSIGRVRGLGASGTGPGTWLMERASGAASLFTSLYFLFSLLMLPDFSFPSVHDWIARPIPAVLVALFVVANFWHARLGLKVVIEDYQADEGNKLVLILLLNAAVIVGVAFALFFIARLALGAA